MFNHLTNTDMIAVANNSVAVINNLTSRRASVIARRTKSEAMGVIKAQMIDLLKESCRWVLLTSYI